MSVEAVLESGEYGGMIYAKNLHGRYTLYFDNEALHTFGTLDKLHLFVDTCNEEFERRTKTLALHLTGCKRCYRTIHRGIIDPCQTGASLILNAKRLHYEIVKAAASVLSGAESFADNDKSGE